MSVYNSEKTVQKSIDSILNQTYTNFELLIVDDFSSDNTLQIIESNYSHNKKIRLFQNKSNIGLTKSLNYLVQHSKGDFIARQDSDDLSFPNRLQKQIEHFNNYNIDFCTSRAIRSDNNRKIPGYSYFIPKKIITKFKNPFIHGTLMIKKDVLREIGYYDERFYYAQDFKLFIDLLSKNYHFKVINEPLYFLNMLNNISSNNKNEQDYYSNCARKNVIPKK